MHRYLAVAGLFLASCSCSGGTASGGGPTPYVRCAAAEAAVIDRQIGSLHARSSGRVLTVDGATTPLRVAVFRGAALADEPIAPALDSIEALRPAIAVVLGSIGDEAHATALVEALAQLAIPTLVVLGGRDRQDVLARAIADLPSSSAGLVVDVSPYRSVQIAGMELIPAAGAPDGRYAVDDAACGLGPADVESIVAEVGSSGTQRFLIGFAGPSPLRGIEHGEAGSALVHELATRVSTTSGIFAWPDVPTAVPRAPSPAFVLAPPLLGPSAELADGSRLPPGPLLLELSQAGLCAPAAP